MVTTNLESCCAAETGSSETGKSVGSLGERVAPLPLEGTPALSAESKLARDAKVRPDALLVSVTAQSDTSISVD